MFKEQGRKGESERGREGERAGENVSIGPAFTQLHCIARLLFTVKDACQTLEACMSTQCSNLDDGCDH